MTLPEGVQPSGPTEPAVVAASPEPAVGTGTVIEDPVVTDSATTEDSVTAAEDTTDAQLRLWAKDNGIEGVPASGRLSAFWREKITAAMASTLDPKEEDSVVDTSSPESSTSVETTMEETETGTSGEETSPSTEEPVKVAPEFETGEYRSVFKPPNTFVNSAISNGTPGG